MRCATIGIVVGVTGSMWFAGLAIAVPVDEECGTTSTIETGRADRCTGDCPAMGVCDCPETRDLWDVGEQAQNPTDIMIRVKINVLDQEVVDDDNADQIILAQVIAIVDHFDDWNLDLHVSWEKFNDPDPDYSVVYNNTDVSNMKSAYADNPSEQLNVYVTDIQIDENDNGIPDYLGRATFAWYDNATGTQGGIIIDGGAFGEHKTTLTHEIGHVFGLWHTHHGATLIELDFHGGGCGSDIAEEVICPCVCYEPAGAETPGRDILGDFCSDTPSTPPNHECGAPGGQEPCEPWENWGMAWYDNFLGYASDVDIPPCRNEFSDQQGRRMHCWACNPLTGWMVGESLGACCLPDDSCMDTAQSCCDNAAGAFIGVQTSCTPKGTCCMGDGGCQYKVAEVCCLEGGGAFLGTEIECETEEHACCLPDGTCIDTTEQCCQEQDGGYRPNKTCATPGWICPTQNK